MRESYSDAGHKLLERIAAGEGILIADGAPNEMSEAMGLDMDKSAGYATELDEYKAAIIRGDVTGWERNQITAHEMGHILMGHVGVNSKSYFDQPDRMERNADTFATIILALTLYDRYREGSHAKSSD